MKKLLFVLALATSVAVVSAQTQEPTQEVKKEACCKKMADSKPGAKMKCGKDCTMSCCKKKTEAKKKA